MVLTTEDFRRIFAEELERNGEPGLARYVRDGSDTSHGGAAALSAMKRVSDHYIGWTADGNSDVLRRA